MSRRDAIDSLFLKKPGSTLPSSSAKSAERVRTGAISAMGASLQEMAENAKQATRLQQQLADGDAVISIDPALIDNWGVADRIPFDIDPAFDELVHSMSEHGQQVPILVRANVQSPGRFQIAYGRRRLKAAEKLGRPVRAIVRDLADAELIVAQGRENLDRKDLSFIEKAFFAKNLEDEGCDRTTIVSALGADKADVSRYISVARDVPADLVALIGPAPKAGRARWLLLVEKLTSPDKVSIARDVAGALATKKADSDTRFEAILRALREPAAKPRATVRAWNTPVGKRGARIEERDGKTSIVFEEAVVPEFAQFVSVKLDELYKQFQSQNGKG